MGLTVEEVFNYLRDSPNIHKYTVNNAWYTGDEESIRNVAKQGSFWKRSKKCNRIHIPIASDLAAFSADLIMGDPPAVYVDKKQEGGRLSNEQARLDYILSRTGFFEKVHAAAETCAALGDVYLKINVDNVLSDVPILYVVQPQNALPEYEQGVLKAIHFITATNSIENLDSKDEKIWMYEKYERGFVTSAVYKGTNESLGEFLSIAAFQTGGYMTAVHITNLLPNKENPYSMLGRSDFEGLYDLFDALDESYSSWIRDVKNGKGRLIVPAEYLQLNENILTGERSFKFDTEEDIFTPIDTSDPDKVGVTQTNFDIRSSQHKDTCLQFLERIISSAGYSPQSFGLHIEGRAESGTALSIREKKTYITKAKKELQWKNKLEMLTKALLEVDSLVFGTEYSTTDVVVEIKDQVGDINTVAQTIQLLDSAGAVSTYTKVQLANPDWSEDSILEEVEKIYLEKNIGEGKLRGADNEQKNI